MADLVGRYADPLEESVRRIAALLGERTGHCAGCGRLGRLTSGGLFPSHRWSQRGGSHCSGTDQPPTEAGGLDG